MDLFIQKAKLFAQETAKKSQEIAKEAAKLSQEIAQQTAKRSKELSKEIVVEAIKTADQLKTFAGELSPSIVGRATTPAPVVASELEEYGITPELREFVKGLTIRTFRDFPLEESNWERTEKVVGGESQIQRDLTQWQERHAILVLTTVPEISGFRYVLCPRRMRESKFWKIYFILVHSHLASYEAQAAQRAADKVHAQEELSSAASLTDARSLSSSAVRERPPGGEAERTSEPKAANSASAENDLDAYLMGALGSDDEGPDEDEDGFDADFDQLVNSGVLYSEGEDATHGITSSGSHDEGNQLGQQKLSARSKAAASEGSSDGELVEMPTDQESDTTTRKAEKVTEM